MLNFMKIAQQTFYIDSDEEISSIIERLRKSLARENFFVLPKRAMVMESIVNLKLLKREADKMKKTVTIITQEELGANMAIRAGLQIRSSLEGLESVSLLETKGAAVEKKSEKEIFITNDEMKEKIKSNLRSVGSDNFYDPTRIDGKVQEVDRKKNIVVKEKSINNGVAHDGRNFDSGRSIPTESQIVSERRPSGLGEIRIQKSDNRILKKLDFQKEQALERMFKGAGDIGVKKEAGSPEREVHVGGWAKIIITSFILLCIVAFIGIAAYLLVPNADILVTVFSQKRKLEMEITGTESQSGINFENKQIPARFLHEVQKISLAYEATGQNSTAGAKARGMIVVYNGFSAEPQTLIATTRFESENGKIFRLLKNVIVPGTTQIDGETKPGVIEVEVVADGAGEEYEIEPTSFTIPGFKESPKFEKFSAKSTKKMVNGGSTGTPIRIVTLRDIENAKIEAESKLKEKIKEIFKNNLQSDEILLDQAIALTPLKSVANVKAGEVQDSFEYTVEYEADAVVFSQKAIEELLVEAYKKEEKKPSEVENLKLDYAALTPDFEDKSLTVKVHGELMLRGDLEAEKLKKEFLGKNQQEIEGIIKLYPQIKNVTFEFEPELVSRVPQYAKRVSLDIIAEN